MSYLKYRTLDESLIIIGWLSCECASLGGPLCSFLNEKVQDGDYQSVIDYVFDYGAYDCNDILYARQIQALLNKQDFLDLGVDKEAVAFSKFEASELACRETNHRLEHVVPEWDVGAVLYYAQRKIDRILGGVPSLDSLELGFGPGATTSAKSAVLNNRIKLSASLECSMNLVPMVGRLLESFPLLSQHNCTSESESSWIVPVTIVPGKLAFVPKNCLTHRSIVVEPVLNGLIQKGIGSHMKKRLKLNGVDLYDQSINQRGACKGSIDGLTATVDLSMASDMISRQLVWSLLPYDWAVMLDQCRSDCVIYKKEVIRLEKFSSMGNAFTFELESLIFYSLAVSTCKYLDIDPKLVTVYGDDIIIPVPAISLFYKVLSWVGFRVNETKSFHDGQFRESCGADYFAGFDIRPFYLKTMINDRVLFSMHNWFVRHCEFSLAAVVLQFVSPPVMLWGPDGYGDGHLIGDYSLNRPRSYTRRGWEGGFFDTYSLKPRMCFKAHPGDWMYPSYSIYVKGEPSYDGSPDTGEIIRGTRGYHRLSIYTLATSIF